MANYNPDDQTNNEPNTSSSSDGGADEVKENMKEENEKGYRGTVPDQTPNENYTVGGVTSGATTPENPDAESDDE